MATEIGPQDSAVKVDPLELSQTGFDPSRSIVPDIVEPRFEEVAKLLRSEPWTFDFFHAVRLLEQFRAGRRAVGHFNDPAREVVRFGAHSSLAFPASSIQSLDPERPEWKMLVNFIGMTGPMGVLPRLYTVAIQDRARIRDTTLRDFLDIFNHRVTSLFYRAWTKYRLPVRYQRGMDDQMSLALASIVGLGTPGLLQRQEIEDETYVWLSGLFGLQARSAVALEQALEDYFQVPAEVVQFVGAWCRLEGDSTCSFDEMEDPSEQLGLGAVVGDEVYDHQARVRVRLGPLSLAEYRRFLPGQPGYRRLRELTRFFSRDQTDFELQLILRRTDVPDPCLAGEPEAARVQLGWTTWMKNRPDFPRDPEDTILFLQ
jgi:type VI secretion system protein ImpH